MSLYSTQFKRFNEVAANIARGRADQRLEPPLTNEVLERILKNLSIPDLLLFERTCRGFRQLIRGSVVLQYKVELHLSCMEDGGSCHLVQERLNFLRKWRSGWHTATWSTNGEMDLEESFSGIQYGNWDVACSCIKNGGEISFSRIQSQSKRIEGRSWVTKVPSKKVHDFVYNTSQDLLVVVEPRSKGTICALRFLTMDGAPHPRATLARISMPCANISDLYLATTCSGTLVSAWFPLGGNQQQLMVWDWSSGTLLLEASWRLNANSCVPGFFDDRYIIVPGYTSFVGTAFLVIVDCKTTEPKKYTSFSDLLDDAVLILDLPPLANDASWVSIFMERALQPVRSVAPSMFSPRQDSGIMGVILWVKKGEGVGQTSQHVLIIPIAPIRARLLPLVESVDLGLVARCPWKKWGSETRYLPIDTRKTYTSICMTRFSTTQEHQGAGEAKPEDILEIFDFDSLPSMLRDFASGDPQKAASIVHEPTKPDPEYFDTDVETMVPYRHLVTGVVVPKGYDADLGEYSVVVHSSNNPRAFWYSI